MKNGIDKSGTHRTKSGGLTGADPQSKEPKSKASGALNSKRGVRSRPMSTAAASRSLQDVSPSKR